MNTPPGLPAIHVLRLNPGDDLRAGLQSAFKELQARGCQAHDARTGFMELVAQPLAVRR